jgi:hypothetical protein
MISSLGARFDAKVGGPLGLRESVLAISRIPYQRPSALTADAVVAEWRGTCSTKHLLLWRLAEERWPHHRIQLWNRVYRVDRELARGRWGDDIAAAVPVDGLIDVHCYATMESNGQRTVIDATFPLATWDGVADLPLWCGDGEDHPAGPHPIESKAELTKRHCDPSVREPFIALLSTVGTPA